MLHGCHSNCISRESIGDCFYSASQQASCVVTSSKFVGQSIRWSSISIVSLNFEILMTWIIFSWLLIIQICSSWVVHLLFPNCRILLPISLNHIIFNYLDVLSLLLLTPDNVSSLFSLLFLSSFFLFLTLVSGVSVDIPRLPCRRHIYFNYFSYGLSSVVFFF